MPLPTDPDERYLYRFEMKLQKLKRKLTDCRAELMLLQCPLVENNGQFTNLLNGIRNETRFLEMIEGDLRAERSVRRRLRLDGNAQAYNVHNIQAIENVD